MATILAVEVRFGRWATDDLVVAVAGVEMVR